MTIPRLSELKQDALYTEISTQISAQVEAEIRKQAGSEWRYKASQIAGMSPEADAARQTGKDVSALMAGRIVGFQQEDVGYIKQHAADEDAIAKTQSLATARAFQIRQEIAGHADWVANFKLNDKADGSGNLTKLDVMSGVDSSGHIIKGTDGKPLAGTLAARLGLSYTAEAKSQLDMQIAQMEADAAKKAAAPPPPAPAPGTGEAPPPVPPATSAPTPQAGEVPPPAPPAPPPPVPGTVTAPPPAASAPPTPAAPPADDAAKKLAELKARQQALAQSQTEQQRADTAAPAVAPPATTPSQGGPMDSISDAFSSFFANLKEGWNNTNKGGGGLIGPLGVLGLAAMMLFDAPMLLIGIALVALLGFIGTSGFGMFGQGGDAHAGPTAPASYTLQQPGGSSPEQVRAAGHQQEAGEQRGTGDTRIPGDVGTGQRFAAADARTPGGAPATPPVALQLAEIVRRSS